MGRGGRQTVAARFRAEIVAKDRQSSLAQFTLSPASLGRVGPGDRLVLTSLNGAEVSSSGAEGAAAVVVACFRNLTAVAAFLAEGLERGLGRRVTIVACAERWSSVGSGPGVRPSVEDWLGAGGLARALAARALSLSPEARAAAASYQAAIREGLDQWLRDCISGRELTAKGFAADVDLAAQLDVSQLVPLRHSDGFFRPAPGSEPALRARRPPAEAR